jgi:glycosyltransferase involved in cell wall biosynthesis
MKIGKCDELRSHFGIPVDCICIGTMGRVTKDKGILEFIQIFETLAVEYPYLYCVIGGNPITDEDELYMKQIIQEINLSKHKDRIHCLGYVDKLDFYPIIDIFCLVTINTIEAFGLVVIESMSAGIPPIAPKIGGPVDIIDDGVSGFLVTPGSVKEYCEKIRILLEDKEIYRTMSASAIERYKDKYTMAVWEKKWMTLLQEIS